MARRNGRRTHDRDVVITALIYTRVSKDDQAKEGLSLPAQLQACRRYCADRGWIIGGEFEDVLSGKRDDRAQYQRLLKDARRLAGEGKPVAVVVMRLDRFGRRLLERVQIWEEFKKLGVQTHSIREGGHVNDMMAGMLAVMAQEEVERLGDRVRDTREHNVTNGWHTPGRAPWGYRWRARTDEEKAQGAPASVLVPDEVTAPYAREMFRMVAGGSAPNAVALWAARLPDEAKGIVTRMVRDKATGERDRKPLPRQLNQSAIRLLLRSAVYIGRYDDGEHVGERGRWELIVDEQTWNAVQARLGSTKRRSGPVSGQHLLTGMIVCPRCGTRMAGWTQSGKWKRYRCNSFAYGGEKTARNCTCTVSSEPVDAAVMEQVAALLAPLAVDDTKLRSEIGRAWGRLQRPNDDLTRERRRALARARKDVDDAKRRIAGAARLLVDGTIDRVAYAELAEQEQARLEDAERILAAPEIKAATQSLPPLSEVLVWLGGWRGVLTGGPIPQQREVLPLLISDVVPHRVSHGKYEADVTWTNIGLALRSLAGLTA